MVHQDIKHYLKQRDSRLAPIIEEVTLPELQFRDVYQSLLSSIISQQLSVKAAATIYDRFLDLFPDRHPDPAVLLQISKENLRSAGLSAQKSGYIHNTAAYFLENNNSLSSWHEWSDEEIVEKLSSIKGVGVWTVQMILIFSLKRQDVFPHLDLGVRNAMKRLYGIGTEPKLLQKEMVEIAENWRPYRSVVSRYLWQWKDGE